MDRLATILKRNIVVVFILILLVLMAILKPTSFFSSTNITNIFIQISSYGVVAFAMTFAIIAGEFDLSVSSIFGMSTILFIDLSSKVSVFIGVLAAILFGLFAGSLNGFFVSKLRTNSFITTLASMMIFKGISLTYTNGAPVNINNNGIYDFGNGKLLGIPYILIILFIVFIGAQIILSRTKFGRNIYATGGNMAVAKLAGINTTFYKFIIFVILGLLSSIGALLYAARVSAGSALYGSDLAIYCVAAVVVGGTSLSGGTGNAVKTLLGLLVMGILFNGLTLLSVKGEFQEIAKGIIVIVVVVFDAYNSNRNRKVLFVDNQDLKVLANKEDI